MKILLATIIIFYSSISYAAENTGSIHTLHVNLQSNLAFVYLENKPVFLEPGCNNYWTANSVDDARFKSFIWPLLMTAKTTKEPILITTNGCNGAYPKILSVDFLPRN